MTQFVDSPTKGDNLLDVIASVDSSAIKGVSVNDGGRLSDHQLIVVKLASHRFKQNVCLASSVGRWPAPVCARSCVSMQEDLGSTPGTDKANQAFHPFRVGEIGISLYIVGYCYRRLHVFGTEGR
jgi:hypothetical protein